MITELPNTETTNPSAIEERFCKPFANLPVYEMDIELAEIYLMLLTVDNNKMLQDKEKVFKTHYVFPIIEKRIDNCFQYKIEFKLLFFLGTLAGANIGKAIMYLWYLQYWCRKNNVPYVDLVTFGIRIFPNGFPCDDDIHKLWIACKVEHNGHSDNLLDYAKAGQSIYFETN